MEHMTRTTGQQQGLDVVVRVVAREKKKHFDLDRLNHSTYVTSTSTYMDKCDVDNLNNLT